MFRGVHNLGVDTKGRVRIPTRHQAKIDEICSGKVVLSIHPNNECLLLYLSKVWQILEEKISALPSLNIHTKRLKRKLIAHVTDYKLEKVVRILIPSILKHYAHIDKKIIMSSQGHNFEL